MFFSASVTIIDKLTNVSPPKVYNSKLDFVDDVVAVIMKKYPKLKKEQIRVSNIRRVK